MMEMSLLCSFAAFAIERTGYDGPAQCVSCVQELHAVGKDMDLRLQALKAELHAQHEVALGTVKKEQAAELARVKASAAEAIATARAEGELALLKLKTEMQAPVKAEAAGVAQQGTHLEPNRVRPCSLSFERTGSLQGPEGCSCRM
jgi:hypothetical protein